ncbi:MAG TPA: Uma2 family endonuclease [Hyphomicrobiaceae bacterium]|nr:Uma2 family endonuclease [Hyphomicrobiaceae bacterium]
MTTQSKPRRMKVAEFLDWAITQPRGRYELVRGEVVAMAPERALHNVVKAEVYVALRDAIKRAGLPCTAFGDGMTVVIDDEHAREPDAAVQCGVEFDPDMLILEAPLIVVEVTSPSSERDDTGEKLVEYFSAPSIQHYLIVNPVKNVVIHHARGQGGDITTRIASSGDIDLTPPGMKVPVAELLPEIG